MQTKEEYLAAVRRWVWSFGQSMELGVPAEWVREAWELPEIQTEYIPHGLRRDVSKTGSLCRSSDYLRWLSDTLTEAQVTRLYLSIRTGCETREEEFRPEFLVAFAQHAHAIPPALTRGEITSLLGMTAEEAETYWREIDAPYQPSTGPLIENDDDIPF